MPLSDDPLSSIEAQLQQLQAALLSSDPAALEQGARQLRAVATAFAQALERHPAGNAWPEAVAERVQAIAQQLNSLRDQLARVLALTQQQAASLLPPVQGVTYGNGGGAPGVARIYRAPG